MLRNKELLLKSNLTELHKLESFVEQISDVYNVNSTYYSNILVVLNEAVTNSIIHANHQEETKNVIIKFESKNKGLVFTITDQGKGFDFNNYPDPTDINIDNYEEIGRGLFLMKSLSDTIEYNEDTHAIEISFKISSINKELAVSRVKSLSAYFKTNEKPVKAH